MVSWAGDGLIVGYDGITKKLKDGLYHFASGGSVDLEGVTRISYPMGAGLSTTTYPNRLKITVPFTFVASDFTANPGKKLSVASFITDAANFPAGHVPTPSEILALGSTKVSVYRGDYYVTSAQTHTFTIPGPAGLAINVKYWVLVLPTALVDPASPWSLANDVPMAGITVNTFGRALSMWTGRTPAAPVITAPVAGYVALPGTEFNLTFDPADPDEVTPSDDQKFNSDVCGVQIQIAPMPSVDQPNPEWTDLQVGMQVDGETFVFTDDCWIIRGASGSGTARLDSLPIIIDNLGLPIRAGATDTDYVSGRGELPGGEWQIRVRTFDFGHPYPNDGTSTTAPGPLGINTATTRILYPPKDNYPAANTSPWSDPLHVSVPAQVPPPIPLSPTNDLAVLEGETIRLLWKYRNTHQPPFDQYIRTVQIRKVGDADWSTVFDGESADPFVDLPPEITGSTVTPVELLSDPGFESGTLSGWSGTIGGVTIYPDQVLQNVTSAPDSHSGTHYLKCTNSTDVGVILAQDFIPDEQYGRFSLSFWMHAATLHDSVGVSQMYWQDAEGNDLYDTDDPFTPTPFYNVFAASPSALGWNQVVAPTIKRPPGGVTLRVLLNPFEDGVDSAPPVEFHVDDFSLMASGVDLDSFSLVSGNEYEWQVQTTDTDGIISSYSALARFWVVPAGGSGGDRPIPSETIDGATLGCGTHRAEIYRRGGLNFTGEITNLSHVDWGRVRDDISTAQVEVSGWDIDCGNLLSKLQTWAYELVLWRNNGYTEDRVWEGPITLLTYEADKVTIEAKDVMGYAYRRIIKQMMSDAGSGNGTTVVNRAMRVLQNVLAPDDPNVLAYLQVLARDDDAMQYRSTPAYSRTAYEEIDDMAANAGLDYTVVGRAILLWGTRHRIGTLPEFKDDDLGSPPIVSEYGMSFANRYAVSDGNGIWGEATRLSDGQDPIYGLVEMLSSTWASDSESDTGTYTQEGLQTVIDSFESFAERAISDRYPPPVVVRVPDNTTLNPDAVISIQHLVPGVVVPLRSTGTLREVVADQKLDSVKVVEEKGKETVSITLSPFSSDDAALGDGDAEA